MAETPLDYREIMLTAKDDIRLTIIIVAWNVRPLVDECLKAVKASDDELEKQIILVDNGSKDGTADFVEHEYPEVELIRSPTNLGFIRANNLAYKHVRGNYVLMLNSDAFVSPTALRETVEFMDRTSDAGVVGARLIGRDGVLQPSARAFPTPLKTFVLNLGLDGKIPFLKPLDDLCRDHSSIRECDWVVGCFLLTRKALVDRTGYFLREDYFMYNDDNDLCKRVSQLGYKTYFYPVDVVHLGGATVKRMHKKTSAGSQVEKYQIESQLIYYRKNHSAIMALGGVLSLMAFDLLLMGKRLAFLRIGEITRTIVPHLRLVFRIAVGTQLGKRSIH